MAQKVIEIKDLNFSYPDGNPALCGISFDVFEGDSLGIIGPNGAGKSTLLLHLNGLLKGNGLVRVNGLDLQEKNLAAIRKQVGVVFQNPDNQLFMPTVFEDVAFGPVNLRYSKNEVNDAVAKALKEVHMLDAAQRASHHLSFGEKKRVAIATVIAMNPSILVLDEPSSNLDPKGRRDAMRYLKSVKITKIIASHDLDMILDLCARVILLDKGRLIAEGKASKILADKKLLAAHDLGDA